MEIRKAIKEAQRHYLTIAGYAIADKPADARLRKAQERFNELVHDYGLQKHPFSIRG